MLLPGAQKFPGSAAVACASHLPGPYSDTLCVHPPAQGTQNPPGTECDTPAGSYT